MSKYKTTSEELTSIANAIRTKGGTSESLSFPDGFVTAIGNISGGAEIESLSVTQNGTYTAPTGKAYSPVTVNVSGSTPTDGDVIFLDYDGTVVATKTKAEINAMTSDSDLPSNPTHTGLTAQGWNWNVVQLKAQLTAMPDQKVYVGQMYVTTSGATEIDIEMRDGRLSPILTIAVNGTVSIDWGDNTTPVELRGTSLTTRQTPSHTYAQAGNYKITITETSGSKYSFYGGSAYTLLRKNTNINQNKVYANCIKHIRLGTGITVITDYAFYYSFSLLSVTIPNTVTSIETYAFYGCYSLASITLPSGVTSIGDYAFYSCYALASINIPSSVTSIGMYAFQNCYSFTSITLPSGVTSIGDYAFQNCYSFTSITLPNSVTSIGTYAFYYCHSLTNITLPNSVTSIGTFTFHTCYSLASITIPNSVTSIGTYAFYNCHSLKSITLSSEVTSIGECAFYNCYSLASIIIPSNVTSIGNTAFQNCYGIAEYHVLPTTPPTLGTTVFKNIVSDCVIYVPQGKLSDYQTATGWSAYASYMQEEPST